MVSIAPDAVPLVNESENMSSRITSGGRKISYKLRVIQRPERARACGQGAKSSSDRRPVDPPPIVDLRVYEGDELRDITFTYNANFFLFATLEDARPKAQGRVPAVNSNQPVLTGTPVAGMAYLDRPTPAGYFIFSDLSVRHEGHFRLSFTLFEEIKESKDSDCEAGASETGPSVHGRCEVKSLPFHVFSAKKFPGLTESTPLSRTVADQGCRVRIRRDIRIRRRREEEPKHRPDGDGDEAPRQSPTPEGLGRQQPPVTPVERQRSISNTSNVSYQPLHQAQRQNSASDLHLQFGRSYPPQTDVGQSQTSVAPLQNDQGHLPHASQLPASLQPHAIPSPYQQSPVTPFNHSHQPQFISQPQASLYHPPSYNYPQAPGGHPNHSMSYGHMPQPMYDHHVPHVRQQSIDYAPPPPPPPPPYQYQRDTSHPGLPPPPPAPQTESSSMSSGNALPPLQRMDLVKVESAYERVIVPPPRPLGGAKRSFGSTFNTQHVSEPLRRGARPDPMADASEDAPDGNQDDSDGEQVMAYKRADGTMQRLKPEDYA